MKNIPSSPEFKEMRTAAAGVRPSLRGTWHAEFMTIQCGGQDVAKTVYPDASRHMVACSPDVVLQTLDAVQATVDIASALEQRCRTFFERWGILEVSLGHADPERQAKSDALAAAEQAIGHVPTGVDKDPSRAFVEGILYALGYLKFADSAEGRAHLRPMTFLELAMLQDFPLPPAYTRPDIIFTSPPCAAIAPSVGAQTSRAAVIRQQVLTEVADALKAEAKRAMDEANHVVCERNEGAANATINMRNLALTWAAQGHVSPREES